MHTSCSAREWYLGPVLKALHSYQDQNYFGGVGLLQFAGYSASAKTQSTFLRYVDRVNRWPNRTWRA